MNIVMGWPQVVLITLWAISIGVNLVRDGTPKTGNHSIWETVVALSINLPLLYFGGFFS